MIITAAFVAEAATAVDSKLHVWGGLFTRYTVGPDRIANVMLVLLTAGEEGNADPTVRIDVIPPDGSEPLNFEFDVPEATATAELGFAYQNIQLGLPTDGRWTLSISTSGAGKPLSVPLTIDTPETAPAAI